jgi:hypothetical protein
MGSLIAFQRLAAMGTSALLVFLNFTSIATSIPPTRGAPTVTQGQLFAAPTPTDRTTLGTLPADLASALTIPGDLPRPLPTNAWWSSGILESFPAPFFPWPLQAVFSPDGLSINAPGRVVAGSTIAHAVRLGPIVRPVAGTLGSARPVRWGDWDVTVRASGSDGSPIFDATLVQGSPVAFLRLLTERLTVALPAEATVTAVVCGAHCTEALLVEVPEVRYIIATDGDLSLQGNILRVERRQGAGRLGIAAVPPGATTEPMLPHLLDAPAGTRVTFEVLPDRVRTTYHFPFPTIIGLFPHQWMHRAAPAPAFLDGHFETLRGTVKLLVAERFTTELPRPPVLPGLPLPESLRSDAAFTKRLQQDIALSVGTSGDVYGAGKELLKVAHLLEIAEGIGDTALTESATTILRRSLTDWCTATPGEQRSFLAWDPRLGGIVALPPAFGSEHYNDHHFHYGYFIRAAAVLARADPSFARDYGDCVRLLIRDIASPDRGDPSFPFLRNFDPYAGHSWASGLTKFGDAQNQESSSEAIQAWYAVALWGRVTGDAVLRDLGTWLLAQEAEAARIYWLASAPESGVFPLEFGKPMASIIWGGKADYLTFFDPSPEAIQGIQFFPAGVALLPVLDRDVVDRLVAPLLTRSPSLWRSTLALAGSLLGRRFDPNAIEEAHRDPVYSMSYLRAMAATTSGLGPYQPRFSPSHGCGAVFGESGRFIAVMDRFPGDPLECSFTDTETGKVHRFGAVGVGAYQRLVDAR